MKFECAATALNIRSTPKGAIVGELRLGDSVSVSDSKASLEWVEAEVTSGVSAGRSGFVRRKWLAQQFSAPPTLVNVDRSDIAALIANRTAEFDSITYGLGKKAKSWADLRSARVVDCSGWVYLLSKEILEGTTASGFAKKLYTFSDEQITKVGDASKKIISGRFLLPQHFEPGVLVGLDFSEYSWDRGRPLDIDHIVAIGADASGLFVSQSSSSGGGVNRVSLDRWLSSLGSLPALGRVHLVDLMDLV